MKIEEKLKAAADWRPTTEMPTGLERRALESQSRPPLRPIGIARPRTVLLTTALAGALCLTVVVRLDKPTVTQSPVTQQTPAPGDKMPTPTEDLGTKKSKLPTQNKKSPTQNKKTGTQTEHLGRKNQDLPRQSEQMPRRKPQTERRKQDAPTPQRNSVAVDTAVDSVTASSRVAVDAPAFTPAYYAQASEDGESVTYTPVAVPLDDPDVIASEARPID